MRLGRWAILGDVIGGQRLGSCSACKSQFMSTHVRVHVGADLLIRCSPCGKQKEAKPC